MLYCLLTEPEQVGFSRFCVNSLIDPIPHCVQQITRDKDGEIWRKAKKACVVLCCAVGPAGIKGSLLKRNKE